MKILFLHGWRSVPGGVKPTYLKDHGHEVINPALDDDNFDAALATAQAEFDKHQPQVVVGSSRGGAVAINIDSGNAKLVLLCPAWKNWGTARTVKSGTVVLHSRSDDVIPFTDSKNLVKNSQMPTSSLIEVGNDHRLADQEPLDAMLAACELGHSEMKGALVIVPCGQKKVWDRFPSAGPTAAGNAYTGPPFGINKTFAKKFGETWIILSAKYGFISPSFLIPQPYNITFKNRRTGPITTAQLREQIQNDDLTRFATVIGLGGKEYRKAIELAFAGVAAQLCFPFSGLPIGKAMQATKCAIATNDPMWERKQIQ